MGDEVGVIEFLSEVTPSNGGPNEVENNVKLSNMGNCETVDELKAEENDEREAMDEDDVTTIEKAKVEENNECDEEKCESMDEDVKVKPAEESEYDDEEDLEEDKESDEGKESDEESLKKHVSKNKSRSAKKDMNKREAKGKKDKEPKTPAVPETPAIERPQRERKSVDRLVSTFKKVKKFEVVKGHGTALKDIPNVQYNLSQKKWEESIKLLHLMLFARRGQVMV
ncbi:hypothetical protein Leryth_010143 [Lithospermum erythrorhizon]|nr:hypothetical protein Leryth_010143 [Lithospermum erythrorhizon]